MIEKSGSLTPAQQPVFISRAEAGITAEGRPIRAWAPIEIGGIRPWQLVNTMEHDPNFYTPPFHVRSFIRNLPVTHERRSVATTILTLEELGEKNISINDLLKPEKLTEYSKYLKTGHKFVRLPQEAVIDGCIQSGDIFPKFDVHSLPIEGLSHSLLARKTEEKFFVSMRDTPPEYSPRLSDHFLFGIEKISE